MTTFYFVRHGEPTYEPIDERKFIGQGRDLAPLTKEGIKGVKETAKDYRLKDCEIIVSSPYTRALQTAAILSKELGIDLEVDVDLHEWIPDIVNYQYKTTEDSIQLYRDFELCKGIPPENENKVWETSENIKRRLNKAMDKYKGKYKKVILVSHGVVMRTVKQQEQIKYAEIVEYILKDN